MLLKKIVPFCLLMVLPNTYESSSEEVPFFEHQYAASLYIKEQYNIVENKTQQLMDIYINNAVSGTKRIIENKKRTRNYSRAVQSELPGAPRSAKRGTLHCLYGQYTQLNRALNQLGDTIQIIPRTTDNAHMSSLAFKRHMTKLYDNAKYPNTVYRGRLYSTDAEYKKSLNRFIHNKCRYTRNYSDFARAKYKQDFEKNNYCASMLNPGSIIIVTSGHAVMYLGQGKVQNNEFIPDPINGQAICCSYNNEHPAVRLTLWDTRKSFAVDIQNIVTKKYENEFRRLDSLNRISNIVNQRCATPRPQHEKRLAETYVKLLKIFDKKAQKKTEAAPQPQPQKNNKRQYPCYVLVYPMERDY